MNPRNILYLFFLVSFPLSAATWVEDSLSIQFKYPRGWIKNITRNEDFMMIDLYRPENARITIDSYRRNDSIDLDRYVEFRIDLLLKNYPDLKIKTEKRLGPERGFDDVIFIVINYTEKDTVVSNRILFAKKAGIYHSIQCKTWLENYHLHKKAFDIVTRSFHYREYTAGSWRNDSVFYLDLVKDEAIIKKIAGLEPLANRTTEIKRPVKPDPEIKPPSENLQK